jgi:alpha-tubulin suppressor-like RCC1 family protein
MNTHRIICSQSHQLCLRAEDGAVYVVGEGEDGSLGLGSVGKVNDLQRLQFPVGRKKREGKSEKKLQDVPPLLCFAAAGWFNLALTVHHKIYAWGQNTCGQLGLGNTQNRNTPCLLKFPDNETPISVFAHGLSSFAFTASGKLYAWGDNSSGQLTFPPTSRSCPVPTRVDYEFPSPLVDLAPGFNHVLGLTREGQVLVWGSNDAGKLARPESCDKSCTPLPVPIPEKISRIFSGSGASFAVTQNGALYGWGRNAYGNLGNGDFRTAYSPQLLIPSGVAEVSCGWAHSVALLKDGSLLAWGYNSTNQLGFETESNQKYPAPLEFFRNKEISGIFCGGNFSAVLVSTGDLYVSGGLVNLAWEKYSDKKFTLPGAGWELFSWLFLGKLDHQSSFYIFPQEVIFHFVLVFFGINK